MAEATRKWKEILCSWNSIINIVNITIIESVQSWLNLSQCSSEKYIFKNPKIHVGPQKTLNNQSNSEQKKIQVILLYCYRFHIEIYLIYIKLYGSVIQKHDAGTKSRHIDQCKQKSQS